MKNWYQIENKNDDVIDISLHDEIGIWGVSAANFLNELGQHKNVKSINLSVHSPGGNVFDGLAMYNGLKNHSAYVSASVEGLAASAASFVLMAADHIAMPENSFLMIHNTHAFAAGESDELRKVADTMDKIQDSIVNIYVKRTRHDETDVREMMSNETWLTANDALGKGFADQVTESADISNKINKFSKYFKNMPAGVNSMKMENITNIQEFEKYLRDAGGFSRSQATYLASTAKHFKQSDSVNDELHSVSAALENLQKKFN